MYIVYYNVLKWIVMKDKKGKGKGREGKGRGVKEREVMGK